MFVRKNFKTKSYLIISRIRSWEKTYICDVCKTSFGQKYILKEHILVRSGIKDF